MAGLLIGLAFFLRSAALFASELVPPPVRADAGDYFMYAYNLWHNRVYSRDFASLDNPQAVVAPDAVRSPGYPLFLYLFMGVGHPGDIIARVFFSQVMLSSLTVGIGFLLFRRILPLFWAAAAALLTAFSPHLIVMTDYLLTETLFCLLMVLSVWFLGLESGPASAKRMAAFGALIAGATLVRPGLQYFSLIVAAFWWIQFGRRAWKAAAAIMLGFMVAVAPWVIRNLESLHRISDDRLQIAFLHHGLYPDFMYDSRVETRGYPYRFDPRSGEIATSTRTVLSEIGDCFRQDPATYALWYFLKKPAAFWSWDIVAGQGDVFVFEMQHSPYFDDPFFIWSHRVMKWLHLPLLALCALGCLLVWRRIPLAGRKAPGRSIVVLRVISLLLMYFTALHMVGAPFPRYSIPLRPFMYAMAMFTLSLASGRAVAIRTRWQASTPEKN
jgi:hypothetical protein